MKRFKWLKPYIRDYLEGILNGKMPRGREKLYYKDKPKHLKYDKVNGKYHVVFIAYYPNVDIVKKSILLRESQKYYTTFIGCCIREDFEIHRWFDEAYEVDHFKEFYTLLSDVSPLAVIIHIPLVEMAAIVIDSLPEHTKIILNSYDTQLFMKPEDHITCQIEKELYKKVCAFTHKMPKEAISEMRQRWGIEAPDYLIHALPHKQFFMDVKDKQLTYPLKVVFAGGVMPYHVAKNNGHGNHIFDPIIKALAKQNIQFTMLANLNARNMYWEEHKRYFDMQSKYNGFQFKKGVPYHQLSKTICNYNFGIIYDNLNESKYDIKHFKYNMATKFFSYLEAGLPILVYEEAEYMRKYVEEYNIGVVYSLNNTNFKDNEYNYSKLLENLKIFRNKNEFTTNIEKLEEIILKI